MLILSIDTSTHICSVALAENGKNIAWQENTEGQLHASIITKQIELLLKITGHTLNKLSAIAISKGPGSYTGLRIGTSAAKGLCYALDIPMIGIPTLQALAIGGIEYAQDISENILYIPMLDAMRMEVYTAVYTNKLHAVLPPEAMIIASDSLKQYFDTTTCYYFGTGAAKCVSQFTHKNATHLPNITCSAKNMAALAYEKFVKGSFENTAYFYPDYLKPYYSTNTKIQNLQT
ncbi:MAG TPA: tRNA (adenosine(37)-N6)-threonylcarbamoyltransferase complex dimerization subunit type 1 TsaB [Chitinophagales bacterium]|nr:tRNA (adenosine(37)-N6)-threonylcarbamoyltransferase complex dimerization subunit type 1 TsaB [Chitinophagales bacterium]